METKKSGRGRFTDAEILLIRKYYGLEIRGNTSKSVVEISKSIWAIYFRKLSTDGKSQHEPPNCTRSIMQFVRGRPVEVCGRKKFLMHFIEERQTTINPTSERRVSGAVNRRRGPKRRKRKTGAQRKKSTTNRERQTTINPTYERRVSAQEIPFTQYPEKKVQSIIGPKRVSTRRAKKADEIPVPKDIKKKNIAENTESIIAPKKVSPMRAKKAIRYTAVFTNLKGSFRPEARYTAVFKNNLKWIFRKVTEGPHTSPDLKRHRKKKG
ncbi:hypothetical protein HNY73_006123 [Argiope bruennichi]|uniref:Uncharacterized protein n=1 Tax=Argiope bruennichi TaxID=94029 RepID=A0A8T0FR80_ARGBR|nr:hypothetical protein HNY73_006123 [Argiope bruennichi]